VATWNDLKVEAPEFAAAGRRLLGEVAFLATVSGHGRPRVHPFCPAIAGGEVWAFVMEHSPKRSDLDANGYFAIHALPGPEDEEFYIVGRAARVLDGDARARALEAMPYDDADDRHHSAFQSTSGRVWRRTWSLRPGTEALWLAAERPFR
jgi:hypothetical protein